MIKNTLPLKELVKKILELDISDKLKTVKQYSDEIGSSVGSIQNLLKELEDSNIVKIKKRGHLGSFLESLDHDKLLEILDVQSIICSMTLPYSKKIEGLASGINRCFDKKIIFLHVWRGSNRINLLRHNHCHFTIVSDFFAQEYLKGNSDLEIALDFDIGSYLTNHILLYKNQDYRKVGIDLSSKDHRLLTESFFKNKSNLTYIDINSDEIPNAIFEGTIDCGIVSFDDLEWNSDISKKGILSEVITDNLYSERLSKAVILINKKDIWIKKILETYLDKEDILNHQQDVIDKKIRPIY